MSRRYTFEEIENWIKENKPKFTLLDFEYRDNGCYIHIKCDDTTHPPIWKKFTHFKNSIHGCKECFKKSKSNSTPFNKLTFEEVKVFIEEKGCKLLTHEYIDSEHNLDIECKCGREFKRTFKKYKNAERYYCNVCSGKQRYTSKEILEILSYCKITSKNKLNLNLSTQQIFICNDCGNEIKCSLQVLIKHKSHPCYNCNSSYIEYSFEGLRHYVENNSECKLLSIEYVNNKLMLKLKCSCEEEFTVSFSKFKDRNKKRCNKCSGYKIFTYEEIKKIIEENGSKLLTLKEEYKNTKQLLKISCAKCGEVYLRSYSDFITNKNKICLLCVIKYISQLKKHTQEYVDNFIKENNCKLLSKYNKANEYIDIECSCGNIFKTTFNDFNSGNKRRCNECSGKISNGESFFINWLNSNNIKYDFQKTFEDCKNLTYLPFDFYIESKNIAIEIDGFLHREFIQPFYKTYDDFLKTQYRDSIKTNYCEENGIKLFRIKYDSMKDIEDWIETYKEIICN
jgi:very-short-patch-repair endonuclease